jgi:trk system potassium uptake protein TrkA
VATVPWTTDRLLRMIIPEGLISEWRDPSGTVTIVNLPYHRHWIGRPLSELDAAVGVHAAFVVRFGRGLLPSPETVVQDGDLIYASVLSRDIHDVADKAAISPVDGL